MPKNKFISLTEEIKYTLLHDHIHTQYKRVAAGRRKANCSSLTQTWSFVSTLTVVFKSELLPSRTLSFKIFQLFVFFRKMYDPTDNNKINSSFNPGIGKDEWTSEYRMMNNSKSNLTLPYSVMGALHSEEQYHVFLAMILRAFISWPTQSSSVY